MRLRSMGYLGAMLLARPHPARSFFSPVVVRIAGHGGWFVVGSSLRSPSLRQASGGGGADLPSQDDNAAILNLPRIYLEENSSASATSTTTTVAANLGSAAVVPLTPAQSNYLHVMRITNPKRWGRLAGHLRVFNGRDGEWLARVVVGSGCPGGDTAPRRKRRNQEALVVECLRMLREQKGPGVPPIALHVGRLKKARRKWVLEKATELGVESIEAVDTEFSTGSEPWEHSKHRAQLIEAAEQCERMQVPGLSSEPASWEEFLQNILPEEGEDCHDEWLVCRERSPDSQPIGRALQEILKSGTDRPTMYHVVVGPEGGWSPSELAAFAELQEERSNVRFVSLGPLVLRAETAAIAAISAVALTDDA